MQYCRVGLEILLQSLAAGNGDQGRRYRRQPEHVPEPHWLPLATTPGHPEYPAAHGDVTGGLAYALEELWNFGT